MSEQSNQPGPPEESPTSSSNGTGAAAASAVTPPAPAVSYEAPQEKSRMKLYFILGAAGTILLTILLTALLYWLGDANQSALERLRDIAVIYIVLMTLIIVVLLAAATAALVYLVFQIKNKAIPMLSEMNATLTRVRGTTEFMSEEAVKPVINVASKIAQWKAMMRVATGGAKKKQKGL